MRRRKREEIDSLELMLDTICNTFGGIVFLALLVCILSRNVVSDQRSQADRDGERLQVAQMQSRLRQLESDSGRLRQSLERQQALLQTFAGQGRSDDETRRLMEQIRSLQEQLARLDDAVARERAASAQAEAAASELSAQAAALNQKLAQTSAAATEKSKRRELKMRTPLARTTYKQQVPVLLAHGRAYQPFTYSRAGFAQDESRGFAAAMVDSELSPDELKECPGVPANDAAKLTAWRRELQSVLSTERHHICLAVWPDSYDAFILIRDAFVSEGFEYQLLIMEKEEPVTFGNSGPGQVQ